MSAPVDKPRQYRGGLGQWEPSAAQRRCRDDAARAFGIDPLALIGRSRLKINVRARWAAVWVLKARWKDMTSSQMGHIIGGRDHSTALYSMTEAEELRARCPVFRKMTEGLLAKAWQATLPLPRMIDVPEDWLPAGGQEVHPKPVSIESQMAERKVAPRNAWVSDDLNAVNRMKGTQSLGAAIEAAGGWPGTRQRRLEHDLERAAA